MTLVENPKTPDSKFRVIHELTYHTKEHSVVRTQYAGVSLHCQRRQGSRYRPANRTSGSLPEVECRSRGGESELEKARLDPARKDTAFPSESTCT
eukprot:1178174-Prorocentrum_minimum.AAC.4